MSVRRRWRFMGRRSPIEVAVRGERLELTVQACTASSSRHSAARLGWCTAALRSSSNAGSSCCQCLRHVSRGPSRAGQARRARVVLMLLGEGESDVGLRARSVLHPQRAEYAPIVLIFMVVAGCNPGTAATSQTIGETAPRPATDEQPKSADALLKPALPAPKAAAEPNSFDALEAYWPAFRSAVEHNDPEKIAALTRFPFETRGDSDDDAVRKLTREQFLQALDSMLNEDPGLLMNGKETQRQHIARSADLTERQYARGDESARVGVFQFDKQSSRWWFTRAYVSDDE